MVFPRWLKRFVLDPYHDLKPFPEVAVDEPEEAEKPKELVIGEPVISLGKSLLESDDWIRSENKRDHRTFVTMKHPFEGLYVRVYIYHRIYAIGKFGGTDYRSLDDWMTPDEQIHICRVMDELDKRAEAKADKERIARLAAEREKFMVLVQPQN